MQRRQPHVPWKMIVAIQCVAAQASWAGLRVMVGYRAAIEDAAAWQLASLTAVFAIPALLAAIPAGRAADKWGGSVVNLMGCSLVIVGLGVPLLLPGLNWLMLACAVIGVGNILAMVGQQGFVVQVTKGAGKDGAFGFFTAAASAGQAVGPPIVMLVTSIITNLFAASQISSNTSIPNTTVGLIVSAAIASIGIFSYLPMRRVEKNSLRNQYVGTRSGISAEKGHKIELSKVWPILVITGIVLVTLDMLYTFIPVWAMEKNLSPEFASLLLFIRAATSMISRLGLGALIRMAGRRFLLIGATLMAAIALTLLPQVGILGAIVFMIFIGVGVGLPQPLTMSWAVEVTHFSQHATILGWLLGANRLAQVTVPLAIGALTVFWGTAIVFYSNAVLLAFAASLVWSRDRSR